MSEDRQRILQIMPASRPAFAVYEHKDINSFSTESIMLWALVEMASGGTCVCGMSLSGKRLDYVEDNESFIGYVDVEEDAILLYQNR